MEISAIFGLVPILFLNNQDKQSLNTVFPYTFDARERYGWRIFPISRYNARGKTSGWNTGFPFTWATSADIVYKVALWISTVTSCFGRLYRSSEITAENNPSKAHNAVEDSEIFAGVGMEGVASSGVSLTESIWLLIASGKFRSWLPSRASLRMRDASDAIVGHGIAFRLQQNVLAALVK